MLRYGLVISCFCFLAFTSRAQKISSIDFEGLSKTNPQYLLSLIDCEVGKDLDTTILSNDMQTLRNLNLFFSVYRRLDVTENGDYDVVFLIEEAVYLYPILSISGFDDQLKVQVGGNQINFLGRAQSLGFLYQFYDRHSFSMFYTAPRHRNGVTGHEAAIAKYSTVEPLYFADTVSDFNFDNYSVSLGGFYWPRERIRLGLGGMYFYELYEQRDNVDLGPISDHVLEFQKYQIRARADYFGINSHYEFREGTSVSLYTETIQTRDVPNSSFVKSTVELSWFKRIGKRGNFGFHNKTGISTNNFSPFSPFVLDGFINVRGIGNRVARGTGELIINTEYRHTILSKKYFIAQLVGLADFGTLRPAGQSISTAFEREQTNLYVGAGLRIHSRWVYNSIFRFDYALDPFNPSEGGFVFGLGQFF